jgi:hypothetical protein
MIEPRLYRAALAPSLLALVLAMFSLQSQPKPLPQGLPADVLFEGDLAAARAERIVDSEPSRRAGSPGDRATGELVARAMARRGFRVERDAFTHAGRRLVNVVASRAGRSRRQLVLVAARDARGSPDTAGSASDTAALMELGRAFQGRPTRLTLVLASVDGATLGEVGAERLARRLGDPGLVETVLVMSDLGAPKQRGSVIVPWSNHTTRGSIGLRRTLADSIREELDQPVQSTGAAGQLFRLAFPLGIGSQGPFLDRGLEAVRISGSGELPPAPGEDAVDRDSLGGLGRAALRTVTAIDQSGSAAHGPDTYVIAVSQVMPGWPLALLALTLLLPALVATVDAFARVRRRHEPVARWLRWLGVWCVPFVAALAAAELMSLLGATPDPPPAAVPPSDIPLDGPAIAVLCGAAAVGAIAFWLARRFVVRPDPDLADSARPGAACALALATVTTAIVLWFVNPFAALMAVPAVHLWMLATLTEPAPPRRARLGMVALGLLLPGLVVVYHLFVLHVHPVAGAWYLLMLVTGHVVGLLTTLIGCAWLAALCATLAVVLARRDPGPPEAPAGPRVYGPGSYAGPGSLGGTQSALRR